MLLLPSHNFFIYIKFTVSSINSLSLFSAQHENGSMFAFALLCESMVQCLCIKTMSTAINMYLYIGKLIVQNSEEHILKIIICRAVLQIRVHFCTLISQDERNPSEFVGVPSQ